MKGFYNNQAYEMPASYDGSPIINKCILDQISDYDLLIIKYPTEVKLEIGKKININE